MKTTAQEAYESDLATIAAGCMIRDDLTSYGSHMLMHADSAIEAVRKLPIDAQTVEKYQQAMFREHDECGVCE